MRAAQRGFSLIEVLVSLSVVLLAVGGLAGLLTDHARLNRSKLLEIETQANARGCLSVVVQTLRSAGWDPALTGVPTVLVDPDLADDVSQIEIFADLDADGSVAGDGEQVLIRHAGSLVEWRRSGAAPFTPLAFHISNDADGDGVAEPMFTPSDPVNPERVLVQVTARSPVRDPRTGDFVRFTVGSEVVLRKAL